LRVLIVARRPVARSGLRGLLDEQGEVAVVGQAGSVAEAGQLAIERAPDVALAIWDAGNTDEIVALAEAVGAAGAALVLLADAPSADQLSAVVRAGVRGFLLPDATAEDVAVALHAVAQGLLVLDPPLGRVLTAPAAPLPPGEAAGEELLTEREREVLHHLALGLPNKTIAARLRISEHTVKFHVGSILAKLGAASRTEAVTRAARRGLLTL
ncbi:MAG: response regulator transcription factor, partial [Chloroflexi bacterium]|nr:response regulator transcription factor [Chloroflexota bacterium]